jgi:hypothetical protein
LYSARAASIVQLLRGSAGGVTTAGSGEVVVMAFNSRRFSPSAVPVKQWEREIEGAAALS